MPTRPLLFLAALAVLALAGCGDDGFEGTAGVPDGYATYEGNGVTFVHPADWKPTTRELSRASPRSASRTPAPATPRRPSR